MRTDTLERLLTTLDVRLDAMAVCEIGPTWRLRVDAIDKVICHFIVRGHGFLEYDDRRIPLNAGTIVIVPPGFAKSISGDGIITQEIAAPDSCEDYEDGLLRFRACSDEASLVLGCASLAATCGGSLGIFEAIAEPLVAGVGGNPLFAGGFDALLKELSGPRIGAGVVAECLMKQAVMFMLREQMEDDSPLLEQLGDQRTLPAVMEIIRKPGEQHTIESLASLCGMSRSTFMKHFADQYRKTPGEFLKHVRMRSAARLLITSPMPIKCLAAAVGYASRSQFSRAFKIAYRVDPTAYRARHLRIDSPPIHKMELNRDVFITEALATRPVRGENSRREKVALQELADRMADDPVDLLPHFVQLAMGLTGAQSAGLSIFDPDKAPDVFEWRYLHGLLAPFENATTPRDDSPCGVTLDVNYPMLLAHPERIYDWIAAENIVVPEVLLIPLYIQGEPLGTLWVVSPREDHFGQADANALSGLASFIGIALKMLRTGGELRTALAA